MNLAEPIDSINKWLKDKYGYGPDGIHPCWRVVLAGDIFEKRLVTHTDEGWELLYPEVREVRKYQHIDKDKFVLERQIPVVGETDIVTLVSYEPAWTFEDRFGNYLPPWWDACCIIIDAIYHQMDKAGFYKKYDDPEATEEARLQKIQHMEEILFGNETPTGDALAHGFGVAGFNQKMNFPPSNDGMEKKQ